MAITPKAAALAVFLGGTAAAGIGWAQTATPTEPAADGAAAATSEAPAAAQPAPETTEPAAPGGAPAPAEGTAAATGGADAPAADAAAAPAEAAAPATGDAPAEPAATADAAPANAAPAAAAPPPAGPAASRDAASVGQYYVDSAQGEWTLRCIRAPEGTDPCELYQLLKDAAGNSVAEVSIIPLTGGAAAGATIVAPLETDLVAGLGMQVDSGRPLGYPFNFCAPVGCVARVGFTQAELDALKRGNAATVTLLPYGLEPDRKVELKLSLAGFTAGMDAVAAKMPPPEARTD